MRTPRDKDNGAAPAADAAGGRQGGLRGWVARVGRWLPARGSGSETASAGDYPAAAPGAAPDALGATLGPEFAAPLARVQDELGAPLDATLMAPADGRAWNAAIATRWNRDLPPLKRVVDIVVDGNPALGSADTRVKVMIPPDPSSGAILYAHGGGWAFGSPESHERIARVLALSSGLPVFSVDYRLAPEDPFPAGLMDLIGVPDTIFQRTVSLGVRLGPLVLAGDSSGANLALASLFHAWSRRQPLPVGAVFFYGVFDYNHGTPSHRSFREGPGLTTAKMERFWDWYLPERAARWLPLASPMRADEAFFRDLPPLYLMAAGVDPLLSDTLGLHRRLEEIGRSDELRVVPGVTHGFLQFSAEYAPAEEELVRAGQAAARFAALR